jgi:hypothetical protein
MRKLEKQWKIVFWVLVILFAIPLAGYILLIFNIKK